MPGDLPLLMVEALVAAFAVAAAVLLLCGGPRRAPVASRVALATVAGVGLGFYAGCFALKVTPHWPPKDDQSRWLTIVFPALLVTELLASFHRVPRLLINALRAAVVAGTARVLLNNTVYLTDLTGPGSAEWTPATQALKLGGLAAALAVVWTLLGLLMARAPGRAVPLALAVTCAGAALVVMLSGYATGGMLGLPLAAALAGIVVASLFFGGDVNLRGAIGPGVVGLFSLLVIGLFFGELSLLHAALLFAAPLLCWVPELVPLGRTRYRLRAATRVALVAVPVALAVVHAGLHMNEGARPVESGEEPSADDYSSFRP